MCVCVCVCVCCCRPISSVNFDEKINILRLIQKRYCSFSVRYRAAF